MSTAAMIVLVGIVKQLTGLVYAKNEFGETRILQPGDAIYSNEHIINMSQGPVEIALNNGQTQTIFGHSSVDESNPDLLEIKSFVDAYKESLGLAADQIFPEDAFKEMLAKLAAKNLVDNRDGIYYVHLDASGDLGLVESGYPTRGLGLGLPVVDDKFGWVPIEKQGVSAPIIFAQQEPEEPAPVGPIASNSTSLLQEANFINLNGTIGNNINTTSIIPVDFGTGGPATENAFQFQSTPTLNSANISDLTSNGDTIIWRIEGNQIIGQADPNGSGEHKGEDVIVITVTTNNNSIEYKVDLNAPLDNTPKVGEEQVSINIPFTITNGSNLSTPGVITVNIQDANGIAENTKNEVTEAALTFGSDPNLTTESATGKLNISYGPDGPSKSEQPFAWDPQAITIKVGDKDINLTSGGQPITFIKDPNNPLVIIGVIQNGSDSQPIEVVKIIATNTNNEITYKVDLIKQLDNLTKDPANQSNDIELNIPYHIVDFDGDKTTATLNLTLVDDKPTALADVDNIIEGINNQTQGNVVLGTDPDAVPYKGTHQKDIVGADGAKVTEIQSLENNAILPVNQNGTVIQGKYGELLINPDGSYSYKFTSQTNIIEPTTDIFKYTITDKDGSQSTTTLTINISDDQTAIVGNALSVVDEAALSTGTNAASTNENVSGTININFGVDQPHVTFTAVSNPTATDAETNANLTLKSDGQTVLFHQINNGSNVFIIGYIAGSGSSPWNNPSNQVFTLTINKDGAYNFSLIKNLDHPDTGVNGSETSTDDQINLHFGFTVSDGNQSAQGAIDILVSDDAPLIDVSLSAPSENLILQTSDGGLPDGLDDVAPELNGDNNPSSTVASVNFSTAFNFTSSYGADGAGTTSVSYSLSTVNGSDSGLKSNGLDIKLYQANGSIVGSTGGDASTGVVFIISVNSQTGVVTLTQSAAIDHAPGGGTTAQLATLAADNLIQLNANATITDRDGDKATDSQTLAIGQNIQFADSGPFVFVYSNGITGILQTSDGGLSGGNFTADNLPSDTNPSKTVATINVLSDISFSSNAGADAPGATTRNLSLKVTAGSDSGLTSDGSKIILYQVDGNHIVGATGGDATTGVVFTLSVDSTAGTLTLTQLAPIDHDSGDGTTTQTETLVENLIQLQVDYSMTDYDGDTAATSVLINIGDNIQFADDGPTISASLTANAENLILQTSDGGLGGNAVAPELSSDTDNSAVVAKVDFSKAFSFTPSYGGDGAGTTSVNYQLQLSAAIPGVDSGLKSDGQTIKLYQAADGTIIGATGNSTTGVVFTVSVDSQTGVVTLVQHAAIDHIDGNGTIDQKASLSLDDLILLIANATITDRDGDTAISSQALGIGNNIQFADDGPVLNNNTPIPPVTTGNILHGDVSNLVSIGADTPIAFSINNDLSALNAQNLTSGGQPLSYSISGDTLTAKVGSTTVFTVQVQSDGHYTFTLVNPIDKPANSGVSVDLSSIIKASDYDKDSVVLNTNTLVITFDNEVPIQNSNEINLSVEEDDIPNIGNNEDNSINKNIFSGSIQTLVTNGDGPSSYSFNSDLSSLTNQNLTSNGIPLTYSVSGNILTADANGTTIYTLVLNSDGTFIFTLKGAVDHAAGLAENELLFDLSNAIKATDSNGDSIFIDAGSFNVKVVDDIPIQTSAVINATVEEDDLVGGNNEDNSVGKTLATGTVASLMTVGADEPASFSLNTDVSGLVSQGLTSKGTALTYSISGNTLTAKAGSAEVFTLQLNTDGSYTFTLKDQLDHAAVQGENNLAIDLSSLIKGTDRDGDSLILDAGSFNITVQDDVPVQNTNVINAKVEEDDLATGNNEDNSSGQTVTSGNISSLISVGADEPASFSLNTDVSGLTSQGLKSQGTALSYSISGNTLTAKAGSTEVFTLQLNTDGSYTFTLKDQLDHPAGNNENNLAIDLSSMIVGSDFDKDNLTLDANSFIITVQDDVPVQTSAVVNATVEEDDLVGGNNEDNSVGKTVATGTVASLMTVGADEPASFSLNTDVSGLVSQGLTSKGTALAYSISGNTLTAKAGSTEVFTLQLNTDGSYTFTLKDQLDHAAVQGENNLAIDLSSLIKGTDRDGDSLILDAGSFNITVQDDVPVQTSAVINATVEEDDLVGGNNEDNSVGKTVATGTVASLMTVGADEPASFSLNTDVSGLVSQGLTSKGTALTYSISGNTLTAKAGSAEVFTLQLNTDGSYTFTLKDQLDHAAVQGENNLAIDLSSLIKGTDRDGDNLTLDVGSFKITVVDDIPVQNGNSINASVEEDDLNNAQSIGNNEDGSVGKTVASGSVANLMNIGADEPASFSLNTDVSGLVSQGLTSKGAALTYSISGNTLTAKAGSLEVFTLQLNTDGSYTFTLKDQLDHPAGGNDENTLAIDLSSLIKGTDRDGDNLTLDVGSFKATVVDDIPTQNGNSINASVQEDDLPTGNNEDGSTGNTIATGSVANLMNIGADEPGSFTLNTDLSGLTSLGLKSQGTALSYSISGDTLTAKAGSTEVFTLQLQSNGTYTFTLKAPLDHPAGGNDENNIAIDFSSLIKGTDRDGDSLTLDAGSFKVTIQDDIPTTPAATNTIQEKSVDTNLLIILDISGSMDEQSGIGGTRLAAAKTAINALIDKYEALGDVAIRIVTFSTNANAIGSVWMTSSSAKTSILSLSPDGSTNYDAALAAAQTAYAASGKIDGANNVSYFLSDGVPNPVSSGIDNTERVVWEQFLENNNIKSYALGMGTGLSATNLAPIAYDATGTAGTTISDAGQISPILVTDFAQLTTTLLSTVNGISGTLSYSFGADGPAATNALTLGSIVSFADAEPTDPVMASLTSRGIPIVWSTSTAANGSLTIIGTQGASGPTILQLTIDPTTKAYTFNLLGQLDHPDINQIGVNDVINLSFNYTIKDADGDTTQGVLVIGVQDDGPLPVFPDSSILANSVQGSATGSLDFIGNVGSDQTGTMVFGTPSDNLLRDTAGNILTSNGQQIVLSGFGTSVLTAKAGNVTVFTVTLDPTNDNYTIAMQNSINNNSADPVNFSLLVNIKDYDGDTALGHIDFTLLKAVDGTNSGETLTGTSAAEFFTALNGNDTVNAGGGNDILYGGVGGDTLNGQDGNDIIRGGAGNDTIDGGNGTDLLDLSDGTAVINFTIVQSTSLTSINLSSIGLGTDNYRNMEGVIGTNFADTITGSSGNDTIMGGKGADTLNIGTGGSDTLTYRSASEGGDVINGFSTNTIATGGDVLNIKDVLQAGSFTGTTSADAYNGGYLLYSGDSTKTMVSVDLDGAAGPAGPTAIATINGMAFSSATNAHNLLQDNIVVH